MPLKKAAFAFPARAQCESPPQSCATLWETIRHSEKEPSERKEKEGRSTKAQTNLTFGSEPAFFCSGMGKKSPFLPRNVRGVLKGEKISL